MMFNNYPGNSILSLPNVKLDENGLIYFLCEQNPMQRKRPGILIDENAYAVNGRLFEEFDIQQRTDGKYIVRPICISNLDVLKSGPAKTYLFGMPGPKNEAEFETEWNNLISNQDELLKLQAKLFPLLSANLVSPTELSHEYLYKAESTNENAVNTKQKTLLFSPTIRKINMQFIKIMLDPRAKLIKYQADQDKSLLEFIGKNMYWNRDQISEARTEYLRAVFDMAGIDGFIDLSLGEIFPNFISITNVKVIMSQETVPPATKEEIDWQHTLAVKKHLEYNFKHPPSNKRG